MIVKDSLARNFFGTRFEMATDTEQRYLSAMASLGQGPYPVAAVAHAFGVNDQRKVSVHRESLIQKGLIWSPRRGSGRLHGAAVRRVLEGQSFGTESLD